MSALGSCWSHSKTKLEPMKPAPPVTRTGFFNVIPQEKTKCNHVEYTAAYQGRGILGQS
jgi:hypothetical protein